MSGGRQDLRRRLHEIAFRQAGYFSAAQAKAVGYSYPAQKYHVDHGNWVRVDRGLFRLPGWPSSADDDYARWTLWSAGRAAISHESALSVHDLSDTNPERVHLTVPRGFRALDQAVVLHHGEVHPGELEQRGPWQVTNVERTLSDVAEGITPQEIVTAAVEAALGRGLTSRRRLLRRAADASEHGALRLERALAATESA